MTSSLDNTASFKHKSIKTIAVQLQILKPWQIQQGLVYAINFSLQSTLNKIIFDQPCKFSKFCSLTEPDLIFRRQRRALKKADSLSSYM